MGRARRLRFGRILLCAKTDPVRQLQTKEKSKWQMYSLEAIVVVVKDLEEEI